MGAELRNLAGRFFADVNGDGDDAYKSADKYKRDQPGWDVADPERAVEIGNAFHRARRVEKNFRDPRHQNQNENENVIAFQATTDRFQFADLEARQDQILANQFLPFALQEVAIFHHHRHKEMRFEHSDARAESIVETVAPRFDPEHHPNDGEIEKENDVRHRRVSERDRNNGSAAGDGPVSGDVEPLSPDHDPAHLAAIKVRHRVDIAGIVNAALERNGRLLVRDWCAIF